MTSAHQESARLSALARVAGAAGEGGGLDEVLQAITEGIESAFGFGAALNYLDPAAGEYVVRAGAGAGTEGIIGMTSSTESWTPLLQSRFEVVSDVFFVPHDSRPGTDLGVVAAPAYAWRGHGHWHPQDMCFVRLRTSRGREFGILSVDSPDDRPLPTLEQFQILRLFAVVGANAVDNVLLSSEVRSLAIEGELGDLRRELEDEVALRRSLLEVGTRLGAASRAASLDIFPLLAERLSTVVPIRTLTIYTADPQTRTAYAIWHSEAGDAPDTAAIMAFAIPYGTGTTGNAAARGETLISNVGSDLEREGDESIDIPDTVDIEEHLMAVPVLVEEQAKAVLVLRRPEGEPRFTAKDTHRAELFAQHVASVFLLNELTEGRRLLSEQVEQLQELNQLKDEFVANVSHELRTPLTAIIGSVMTVAGLGDVLDPVERREMLIGAERQAKRLAELLENLLAESRLMGDGPALVPTWVKIQPFLDEIADTIRFRAPGRVIVIRASPHLEVVTDRTLLDRILFNLGDNAIKYSDGPVRFVAEPDGDGVRIDVVDEGPGIEPEDLPRIFEQFEQLDGSMSRRVGGVGLGLHLCSQAAAVLGAEISVTSRVGEGSAFSLRLPSKVPLPDHPA
jgi:signal transduction histidine kinase